MKIYLKISLVALLFLPLTVLATSTVPWSITNLTDTGIFPVTVNGSTKGIIVSASSTIGNGTPTGGLTISGGATTTGFLSVTGTTGTTSIALGQGFMVGGGQLMVQQGSGNVAVGTTTTNGYVTTIASGTGAQNYLELLRNSTNSVDFIVNGFGLTAIRGSTITATPTSTALTGTLTVNTGAANTGGVYIKGAANQYADLQDWINSSGTILDNVTSAGNVGVGTSSPLARLDVAGINNGTAPLFQLSSVASFATTTRFFVSNAGNIGIGTTTPSAKLAIQANNGDTNTTLFTIASSTQTATSTLFSVSNTGHLMGSSTNPTLSSCGTNPTINGDDRHFYVTVGSVAATGCTITFAQPYPARPECTLSNESMSVVNAMTYTVSATAITVTQTGLTGDVLDGECNGF